MQIVEQLFEMSGIGRNRMQLKWVSAAEGQIFANFITELSQQVQEMGPFDPEQHKLPLAAVDGALNSFRLRWLMGMDRQLTEKEGVYHSKIDEKDYGVMLRNAAESEYQKALILEALRDGPLSVREIAGKSGLAVYAVSQLLGEIERTGQAEFHGYEGTTPKFVRLAA
jgi:F420-non-reducing hydrogenase iron-sulfur subunit